jgi:hypothetical protein
VVPADLLLRVLVIGSTHWSISVSRSLNCWTQTMIRFSDVVHRLLRVRRSRSRPAASHFGGAETGTKGQRIFAHEGFSGKDGRRRKEVNGRPSESLGWGCPRIRL